MRPYSIDLRERVLRAAQSGRPLREISHLFRVSVNTIKRYQTLAQEGDLHPKPIPGRGRHIGLDEQADLARQLEAHPDVTLAEHCLLWQESHGVRVSIATMHRSIRRLGYTLKKRA